MVSYLSVFTYLMEVNLKHFLPCQSRILLVRHSKDRSRQSVGDGVFACTFTDPQLLRAKAQILCQQILFPKHQKNATDQVSQISKRETLKYNS